MSTPRLLAVLVAACVVAGTVCVWLALWYDHVWLLVPALFAYLAAFYGTVVLVEYRRSRPR